jgi:hypothetical protein
MIYFLWRHQNDYRFSDKRFAFEAKSGVYDYYEPTTNAEDEYVTRKIKEDTLELFKVSDILVVADISESTQPAQHCKWTLIFSSPNPSRYKEFMKAHNSYTLIVPTWSEKELLAVNPNIDEWNDRFIKCGKIDCMFNY